MQSHTCNTHCIIDVVVLATAHRVGKIAVTAAEVAPCHHPSLLPSVTHSGMRSAVHGEILGMASRLLPTQS